MTNAHSTVLNSIRTTALGRRSLLEPEAELIVVSARAQQTWGRAPLLRLVGAEGDGRPHYRIAFGDDSNDFILNKKDGTWALRLRRHLKTNAVKFCNNNNNQRKKKAQLFFKKENFLLNNNNKPVFIAKTLQNIISLKLY